nr:Ycf41 [Thalassionema frauenfeldii]
MNQINSIIRILEISPLKFYEDKIVMIKFRAQLPFVRSESKQPTICEFIIWGNLAFDLINYYRVNDYVLIEGFFSKILLSNNQQPLVTITISKFYPFLFSFK